MAQVELINPKVRAMCHDGTATPDEFWAHAAEALPWFRRWDQVFD